MVFDLKYIDTIPFKEKKPHLLKKKQKNSITQGHAFTNIDWFL